jgi:beta-glucanase (GH16 family)
MGLEGPPFGHPSATASYPEYPGFTLWLVEEFDEPLDLDADPIWTWSDGGLSEGQVRFAREGISFADGKMRLTVTDAASATAAPQSCSHAEYGTVFNKPLISGEMRTRYNMFRYGRYEARLKAPSVKPGNAEINGNYIATLFAFRTPKFMQWREIDIEVTGNGPNTVTTNLITANDTFAWNADIQEVNAYTFDGVNTRTEFHDFAFEWVPDRITWYLDGEVVRERLAGDGGLPIPEKSTKIMMNLWVFNGGAFGGSEGANNEYPFFSEYEWVRFYKWNDDAEYPCSDMSTACLAADDMVLSSNNPCDGIPQSGTINGKEACQASCN